MRILVPWKPVVLVWGLLSAMIFVGFVVTPCSRDFMDERVDENPHARAEWCGWEFGGFHGRPALSHPNNFGCEYTVADEFGARFHTKRWRMRTASRRLSSCSSNAVETAKEGKLNVEGELAA
jgi:hypothetical protein